MPRFFEQPAQNYNNVDEFRELAIKTLNGLYAHHKRLDTFDFGERLCEKDNIKYYTCVAYAKGEKAPAEQKAGEILSPEQIEAMEKARLDAIERAKAGELLVNATDGAVKFAAANGVDLTKVKGSGQNGRIGQPDVVAWLKDNPKT